MLRHVTSPSHVSHFWEGETCFKPGQSFSGTEASASDSKVEQHIKDQNMKCYNAPNLYGYHLISAVTRLSE